MGKILKLVPPSETSPVAEVLVDACMTDLRDVVIIGWTEDGQHYFNSTYASGPECLWLLEMAKKELLEQGLE